MKFIAITGPDACGKDTQIEKLSSNLKAQGLKVQKLSIQDSLQDFVEIADMKTINAVLNVFLLKMPAEARSHFLLSLLKNSIAKINSQADVILYNGYWYKYAASEQAYGVAREMWLKNIESLPRPDLIIEIQASFENCLLRRAQWSAYESGQALPKLEFHSFQKSMRAALSDILSSLNPKVSVNGDRNEGSTADEIISKVSPLLKK